MLIIILQIQPTTGLPPNPTHIPPDTPSPHLLHPPLPNRTCRGGLREKELHATATGGDEREAVPGGIGIWFKWVAVAVGDD